MVPTYDAAPSAVHFDVVDMGSAWNGYRYWMAFTPWPSDARENPSIVAANKLTNWVEPAGISNPVAPLADATAAGFTYQSDTDMVYDGTNLRLYYRLVNGTSDESVYVRTSGDGTTWSAGSEVLAATYETALSPAVVKLPDDFYVMWTCNVAAADANHLEKRTSTDGLSWVSAPTTCSIPATSPWSLWHIDVAQDDDGTFHLLGQIRNGNAFRLIHWTSVDGDTWSGDETAFVTPSGESWDINGYYRSALILHGTTSATVILSGSNAGASQFLPGIVTLPI